RLTTVAPLLSTRGQEAPEMTHLMHRARSLTSVMMVEDPAARTVTSWAATLTSTHTLAPLYPQPGDHHQHHLPPARPRPPPPRAPHHARRPLGDAAPLVAVPGGGRNAVCGGGAGGGSPRAGPRCQELLLLCDTPLPAAHQRAGPTHCRCSDSDYSVGGLTRQDGWPASPTPIRPLPTTPTAHTAPFHAALNTPSGLHNLMARFGGLQRAGQSEACVIEGQLLIIKLME
ncbi:hypothetical protein O3P69_010105, partial [Scylla paramamosain]